MTAYACHNRPPYRQHMKAQDGYSSRRGIPVVRMVAVPFRMAKDCQYTLSQLGQADQRCTGCQWKK